MELKKKLKNECRGNWLRNERSAPKEGEEQMKEDNIYKKNCNDPNLHNQTYKIKLVVITFI